MTTVTSGIPRGRSGPQAFDFESLWRPRVIADPDRLNPELCVRSSEEIKVASIVIGFDNRLNVAIGIDFFEQ
jgi:hypothetical protein